MATDQELHYDKRRMPVAVYKFPIKYFFQWNTCQDIKVAIDPVTNELYISCNYGISSKILVFDNTDLVREIRNELLGFSREILVSDSAIFIHQWKGDYSILKLSKNGTIISKIRTKMFQNLCFLQGMLYAITCEEMFVFDEDLRSLFDCELNLESSSLLLGVTIKFNVVFIGTKIITGLKIYMYTLDGYFISHFWVLQDFFLNMIYFDNFMCMDSVGSIILLETALKISRLSIKMLEFGKRTEHLGTNLLSNIKAVIIDNKGRIVCVTSRSITYNIYIF